MAHTFADGPALIPCAIFGAADSGWYWGLHQVAGVALIAHGLVEREVGPKLDAVGQGARIPTTDD